MPFLDLLRSQADTQMIALETTACQIWCYDLCSFIIQKVIQSLEASVFYDVTPWYKTDRCKATWHSKFHVSSSAVTLYVFYQTKRRHRSLHLEYNTLSVPNAWFWECAPRWEHCCWLVIKQLFLFMLHCVDTIIKNFFRYVLGFLVCLLSDTVIC